MTLGKSLAFSEFQLPSLKNEEKNTYLSEVLRLVREYEVPGMLPGMK